jgi:flagellar assembly protein FliH
MSSGEVRRWQAPTVAGGGAAQARPSLGYPLTAERLAQIEAEARAQGHAQGLAEGRAEGRESVQREAARVAALADALTPQIDLLDDALTEQLAVLVTTALRHFVRRDLQREPGEVVRVVRECLAVLPAAESRISVHLHPEDAGLVREALATDGFERAWRLVEDPTLARGGARLVTETSTVDATVETRLNALVARLLGDGRRREDRTAAAAGS